MWLANIYLEFWISYDSTANMFLFCFSIGYFFLFLLPRLLLLLVFFQIPSLANLIMHLSQKKVPASNMERRACAHLRCRLFSRWPVYDSAIIICAHLSNLYCVLTITTMPCLSPLTRNKTICTTTIMILCGHTHSHTHRNYPEYFQRYCVASQIIFFSRCFLPLSVFVFACFLLLWCSDLFILLFFSVLFNFLLHLEKYHKKIYGHVKNVSFGKQQQAVTAMRWRRYWLLCCSHCFLLIIQISILLRCNPRLVSGPDRIVRVC